MVEGEVMALTEATLLLVVLQAEEEMLLFRRETQSCSCSLSAM